MSLTVVYAQRRMARWRAAAAGSPDPAAALCGGTCAAGLQVPERYTEIRPAPAFAVTMDLTLQAVSSE